MILKKKKKFIIFKGFFCIVVFMLNCSKSVLLEVWGSSVANLEMLPSRSDSRQKFRNA